MIPFDDFKKVELKTAKILAAERVEGSEKLVKLTLDAGDKDVAGLPARLAGAPAKRAIRSIVAGIGKAYDPASLVGRSIVIVANLEPRTIMGLESNGMLLAAGDADGVPVLLMPDRETPPGAPIS